MTSFLRNVPIKRKLMFVIMVTSTCALLLMGSALITYELITFRRSLALNMNVLAQIIGSNSAAALAFRDPKNAQETLSALCADKQITAAAIYDGNGEIFARFPPSLPLSNFPAHPARRGHVFKDGHLFLFQPIVQEEIPLGAIFLQADLGEMYSRFNVYGMMLLLVGAFASLGAMVLTATLQRRISLPILELAKVAAAVSEREDYGVRAVKHGSDEIGQLTDAFNQMLIRIGESNTALKATDERLQLALKGSQTGTWDSNLLTGRITWDDYMYPLFRCTREAFDGTLKSWLKLVHSADRADLTRAMRKAVMEKRDLDVAFRIIDCAGNIRYMASRGRAFYSQEGKAVRMSGVSMDVTAAKQNEEDLNHAKEAAEAANKAKDTFLAILSHELRTPLTPVLATVAMLEEDRTIPVNILGELETIRRNIEVEARLIDDLLDVTSIIRGRLDLHRRVVDLRILLEHAMESYCSAAAAKKKLHVSTEITATHTHVLADRSRLTQVLWNLLQNACKFTPLSGAIKIRVYNEPATAMAGSSLNGKEAYPDLIVEISDTGIGISAETMPGIFTAFEQGERSRTRVFGGLGLGLAISRAIVDLHNGSLTAESEGRNKGSRFILRLGTVAPGLGRKTTRLTTIPAGQPSSQSLRILLVEDHADTAIQLCRLLERAGHHVTSAACLEEARAQAKAAAAQTHNGCGFDLLVSDLGLPDGSGHDLMRELAERYGLSGVALSGYGMKEDIEKSLAVGFAQHITKPVDWFELKAAIQKIAEETLV
jgi:signal transduction histidine kinase/ActR/RegA family two-component response regulator